MEAVSQPRQAVLAPPGSGVEFRRLLENLPAAAYTCDAQGLITYFNRRAVQAWGLVPKLKDPQDRYWGSLRLYTPDGQLVRHDECWMARCLHEQQEYAGEEIVIERPNGSRLTVQAYATPLYDEQGEVIGAVNVLVDITGRKRTEQQLRGSERELADFFEHAPLGLHWVGPDGVILRANRTELNLLGYSRGEYVGRHIAEFHADKHVIEDILRRLQAGEELHEYEARLRCKNGAIRHVLINSNVLWENGEFIHTRCFTRDITERKQAEERLRKSEELSRQRLAELETIYASAPVGLTFVDRDLRYVRINRALADMDGMPVEQIIGRTISEVLPPEVADHVIPLYRRVIETGQPIDGIEVHGSTRVGVPRNFLVSYQPVKATDGSVLGVNAAVQDISERKRVEEALRESEQRLAAELACTAALQEASSQMIQEGDVEALYEQILDAAVAITRSDMASMQIVDEGQNALRMLAFRGFEPAFGQVFELNGPDTRTSCSVARRVGHRVVVPDVETCEFIVGTPALEDHRQAGIRAVQSTPLISRSGRVLGMISTHWRQPHQPSERDLRLLDVLARQAADLIERSQAEQALRQIHAELRNQAQELTRFNRAAVGRELRMIELKKEVNELCERLGHAPPYALEFETETAGV